VSTLEGEVAIVADAAKGIGAKLPRDLGRAGWWGGREATSRCPRSSLWNGSPSGSFLRLRAQQIGRHLRGRLPCAATSSWVPRGESRHSLTAILWR